MTLTIKEAFTIKNKMKQKTKRIIFEFTEYTVIYTPLPKEKYGQTHFEAVVIRGKTLVSSWKVSSFPNRTNALKLINNK